MYDRSPRTNRFLLVTLVTGFVAIVGPAWGGQVIHEDLKLLASDGAENDWFGNSIVIDDGVVTVGAPGDDANGYLSGSAYFFDASTGAQISKFFPNDGVAEARFGFSIAIDNGIVAVGASYDDDNGLGSGSAYLFEAITGTQIAKLLPSDGAPLDQFGWSIAIGNGIVAIGAYWDNDNGTNSGSAYLFDAITGAQIAKLLPSDGAEYDQFGHSVAIDNGVVAIGMWQDDDNGTDSGSAYVFDLCPADFNNDGIVNTLDFIAYLNAYNVGDPRADMNGDGVVNTLDFIAFLNAYNEGC